MKSMVQIPVPEGHAELLSVLAKLPEPEAGKSLKTWQQRLAWDKHSSAWRWTGERIDYLQRLELGFLPPDPFDRVAWEHPKMRELATIHGDLYFAILKLVVKGFPEIKSAAQSEGLDFPFAIPRELFTQICKEDANYGASEVFGTDTKDDLSQLRKTNVEDGAFFRGRLPPKQEQKKLSALKNGGWTYFWLFAIWKFRLRKELRDEWRFFLACHKSLCRFLAKGNSKEVRITLALWREGHPFSPRTGSPIDPILLRSVKSRQFFH